MANCTFCEKKETSLYTCPKCNLNYCSVLCYQSQSHSQCSEQFYRQCVEEELNSNQNCALNGKTNERSKTQTLAALKRLQEEEENDQEILNEVLDSDDEEDVSSRFDGIDLDDSNKIWEKLLDSEKQEFQKMLETGEIEKYIPKYIPWWDQVFDESKLMVESIKDNSNLLKSEVYLKNLKTKIPKVNIEEITKLPSLLGSTKPSSHIKFNLINVLFAYTYSVRYFRGDHHKYHDSFIEMVFLLSGNLRDNHTFESADIAIQSAISSVNQHSMISVSPEFTKYCKCDVMKIISGPRLDKGSESSFQNIFLLAAITDMKDAVSLCAQKTKSKTENRKCNERTQESKNSSQLPGWLLNDGLFNESRIVQHDKSLLKKTIKKLDFYLSWILDCYSQYEINDKGINM